MLGAPSCGGRAERSEMETAGEQGLRERNLHHKTADPGAEEGTGRETDGRGPLSPECSL